MNSFISWIGGKKLLRDEILARLPPQYDKYIEVFGGAGWVLFRRTPDKGMEVYNDFNSNLVNLFRCVRDKPNKLKYKLRYVLNSREDFDWIAMLHKKKLFPRLRDVDRAAKFFQLIRYSYASGLDSFGCQPHSMWADFPQIDMASMRLQKVLIENCDFEKLIKQYDSAGSFFYCDPPYFATENYYKDVGFTAKDHLRLRDTLMGIKGKFLVSYNDCESSIINWTKNIKPWYNRIKKEKGGKKNVRKDEELHRGIQKADSAAVKKRQIGEFNSKGLWGIKIQRNEVGERFQ